MKSLFKTVILASLFTAFSSVPAAPVQVDYPFCPCELIAARIDIVGLAITLVTSLITGTKFIRAFTTRHDYARNFVSDTRDIEMYLIDAHAITSKRNKLRSKTLHARTFASHSYNDIVKKCVAWEKDIDPDLVVVVQPAVSLHSNGFYKLKRLTLKGAKQRKFLEEKLISHFEVPTPNRWTYGKKAALWSIPFGLSIYGVYACCSGLIRFANRYFRVVAPHHHVGGTPWRM